jgi:hypothetical protein
MGRKTAARSGVVVIHVTGVVVAIIATETGTTTTTSETETITVTVATVAIVVRVRVRIRIAIEMIRDRIAVGPALRISGASRRLVAVVETAEVAVAIPQQRRRSHRQ